jgi:monoterpene epsilon-lactone hydrolase
LRGRRGRAAPIAAAEGMEYNKTDNEIVIQEAAMPEPKKYTGALILGKKLRALIPQRADDADKLDPMMRAIKAVHSATRPGSTAAEDLERQRAGQELLGRLVSPAIGVKYEAFCVQGPAGPIPAEWASQEAGHDRRHIILYCHGGGYTCGQLGYARVLAGKLAVASGCDVLSFEYRLAPEHLYPAALQDTLAVWDHLLYLGYGARDIVVAGDSAGGNLALELSLRLKAQGRRQPRALVLLSPWTDMTASGRSYQDCAAMDPLLTMDYIASVREAYTGPGADWADPCYSPLWGDLRGLPPTLIQVGTHEILRSDSELLYKKMQRQNVFATLEVYADCWHVFQQMPIKKAAIAMESIGRFLQRIYA